MRTRYRFAALAAVFLVAIVLVGVPASAQLPAGTSLEGYGHKNIKVESPL